MPAAPGTTSLALITHADCLTHDNGPGHPEAPRRLQAIHRRFDAELVAPGRAAWLQAPLAADDDVLLVHTPAYAAQLARVDAAGGGWLDPDTSLGPGSLAAARRAVGAALLAVQRALDGAGPSFCATRPPGHHATPNRAMGFCIYSTAAIAARAALVRHGAERVLIVDWDVHHGNGTADCLRSEPRVHYVSLHQWPFYPGTGLADDTGCGNLFHVPRPPGLAPERYVADLLEAVEHAVDGWAPQLVIHSAGFDALRGDPIGGFTLEPEDYGQITRGIGERSGPVPTMSVLEGGYEPERVAEAAAVHAAALVS